MNRKQTQFALLAFAALAGLLFFGSQVGASVLPTGTSPHAVSAPAGPGLAPMAYSCSTPGFGATANYFTSTNPHSIAAGDINGDGVVDLVTANSGSNNIGRHLGNGAGGFGTEFTWG